MANVTASNVIVQNTISANTVSAGSAFFTTINGVTPDATFTTTLSDNNTTQVPLTGLPQNYGLYNVLVRPTTALSTRPFATFLIGRTGLTTGAGATNRLVNIPGSGGNGNQGSQIAITWPANSLPLLYYSSAPGTAGTTSFTIRYTTV